MREVMEGVDLVSFGAAPANGEGSLFRIRNVMLTGAGGGYASWIEPYTKKIGEADADEWLPAADVNEDGSRNGEEYIAGTDPTRSEDRLEARLKNDPLQLTWETKEGRLYTVWRADTPDAPYENLTPGEPVVGDGATHTMPLSDFSERLHAVYHIRVTLPQ